MSEISKIKDAVAVIARTTDIDARNLIADITAWNKDKVYPVSLIDIRIDKDGVTDNSDFVGGIVTKIEEAVKETVANELDLENVTDMKKTVAEIGKWLIETRKIQTNPLKDIATKYTAFESKFGTFNTNLTNKIDAINEKEYQKAEKAIREYFGELLKDVEVEYNFQIFDSFIATKRKNQVFTEKSVLNKKIKDEIAEQVRLVIEPLLKAKELEAKKSLQSKQFENYLANIKIDGDNSQIELSINELTRMTIQTKELYPDIIEYCQRAIENKISFAKANITANRMVAERQAVVSVDNKLMEEFSKLEDESKSLTIELDRLKYIVMRLREIYHEVKFADNQEKVKTLGASVALRITEMEKKEIEATVIPKEEPAPFNHYSYTRTFSVSIEDIEVIAGMGIEAESEEDAKKELCRRFEAHLSMVDLISKGE